MRYHPELEKIFSPTPVRPRTTIDKTIAAAKEILGAEKAVRDERTARLRALRMGRVLEDAIVSGTSRKGRVRNQISPATVKIA